MIEMITKRIKEVRKIYSRLDKQIQINAEKNKVVCVKSCNACCRYNHIEATILEFLPAAFSLYTCGNYEAVLDKLEKSTDPICAFYNPFLDAGACSMYAERGLVCRLFGFAVKMNKHMERSLVGCKLIKDNSDPVMLSNYISKAPVASEYYWQLYGIDTQLAARFFPVNEAIKRAIEYVLINRHYRKPRKAS